MIKWMEKIFYCKCPHCKEHGIIIWSKLKTKGNLDVFCKECKPVFRRKLLSAYLSSAFSIIGSTGLWVILERIGIHVPHILKSFIIIATMYLVAYYYPLKEKKSKIRPVAMEREDE